MPEIPELPRWILEIGFVVYALLVSLVVVTERRRPGATLAWILALVFLPVFGVLAYLLIGRRPMRRLRRRRRRRPANVRDAARQMAHVEDLPEELDPAQRGLVRLALRTAAAPLHRADRVRLLRAGDEAWCAMLAAVRSARHEIALEFYIWRDDASGRRMVEALAERARAGVSVRILVDHLGSFTTPTAHFAPLKEAGGEVAAFGPQLLPSLRGSRANFRNHRKLVAIDGRVGFVGGLNIGDEYLGEDVSGSLWEDLFVEIEGDAVACLDCVFIEDWFDATGEVLELSSDARTAVSTGPLVQIVPSGPDMPVAPAIAAQFSAAIASAQRRCWIATPYLVPDEALAFTLQTASLRGVDLRVVVPERGDSCIVTLASRSYFAPLLEAGCRIYEHRYMLHSKYLVVDDDLAAIGSANMDVRSFHLNYEIAAFFYDRSVNEELAKIFLTDLAKAREVTRVELPERRGAGTVASSFARLLSPLL